MAGRTGRARGALEALNLFAADVQAGVGPFLGVFLQGHGWRAGAVGMAMTIGGVAAMAITGPAGAWIDATPRKRSFIVVAGVLTLLGSGLVWLSQSFAVVAASQVASAAAGAAIGPAISGLTLGIVGQRGFNRQNGRNQAFNHAGNMLGAGLSGLLGGWLGFAAVFALAALFGVLSIVSVLLIPRAAIDDRAARGLDAAKDGGPGAKGMAILLECPPLLVLAGALLMFHLGNAAMLPLFGMAVVARRLADPASFVALTVVVAQGVMIATSLIAMRLAERRGYWLVSLAAFLALPVRGLLAAGLITSWGVWPVQALDGVGAGLLSVAVAGLVARIMDGTGRVNVAQGAVLTAQGLGAAFSPALGGWLAQGIGYPAAFLALGAVSIGSILLWLGFAPLLRPACARPSDAPHTARGAQATA